VFALSVVLGIVFMGWPRGFYTFSRRPDLGKGDHSNSRRFLFAVIPGEIRPPFELLSATAPPVSIPISALALRLRASRACLD